MKSTYIKFLSFIFLIMIVIFSNQTSVNARSLNPNQVHRIRRFGPMLTDEQRDMLDRKKQELKQKYLQEYDSLTEEDKKQALDNYKKELRDYCEQEFGIKIDESYLKRFDFR